MQLPYQAAWQTLVHHLQILLIDGTHTLLNPEMSAVLLVGRVPAILAEETRLEELKELMGLDGVLLGAAEAGSPEKMREVIVGGLSTYGHRFAQHVGLLARYELDRYGEVAREAREILNAWAGGLPNVTARADETEARSRYFLHVLALVPELARVAAANVFKLPPDVPCATKRAFGTP
jgi:hypothetical protein